MLGGQATTLAVPNLIALVVVVYQAHLGGLGCWVEADEVGGATIVGVFDQRGKDSAGGLTPARVAPLSSRQDATIAGHINGGVTIIVVVFNQHDQVLASIKDRRALPVAKGGGIE